MDALCRADHLIIPGGISNQLMIMTRLVEHCCADMGSRTGVVLLPRIAADVFGNGKRTGLYVGQVLDAEVLSRSFLRSLNCSAMEEPTFQRLKREGTIIARPTLVIRPRLPPLRDRVTTVLRDVYHSMEPSAGLALRLRRCRREVQQKLGPDYVLVHMRVERDWYPSYCSNREAKEVGLRACFTPREISHIVLNTSDLASVESVALMYAADKLHRDFLVEGSGPLDVWPARVRRVAVPALDCFDGVQTHAERSALSFLLAADSPRLVGTMKSTMINMLTLRRQLKGNRATFLYDCPVTAYAKAILAPDYNSYAETKAFCAKGATPGASVEGSPQRDSAWKRLWKAIGVGGDGWIPKRRRASSVLLRGAH